MNIAILCPADAPAAYNRAAEAFQSLYQQITGTLLSIIREDDNRSALVVIGSDAVNDFLMREMLDLRVEHLGIRYGTDDYCIHSYYHEERPVLLLAGGRGRSTLYAVYRYFELYGGCHYFWDGDVIPPASSLPMTDIHCTESPRFDYRGLRYFAHRGLKRFQAEHWSFEDWKRELDWLVKRRLNLFMLRIGMDDLWQRAFPEDVPYPEDFFTMSDRPDAVAYNDRTDFWTLRERGELRRRVYAYARELDLMSPVDCGTMTHWYSRTPQSFLDSRKPSFLTQERRQYDETNDGKVFDITKKENMDYYTRLTETEVAEYAKDDTLFHTIGLAERTMYLDERKNFALKHTTLRRIAEAIRQNHPNGKLLLASWDFLCWWTPEQIRQLLSEMDPKRTLLLDYISCAVDPQNCFKSWGTVGKFPWIFGIFHAYESETELRGPYAIIERRLQEAAADPMCRGMIAWPELSHSDPLMLEYLAENAWEPTKTDVQTLLQSFCYNRYGAHAAEMHHHWQVLLPLIELGDWGGAGATKRSREDPEYIQYHPSFFTHEDIWTRLLLFLGHPDSRDPLLYRHFDEKIQKTIPLLSDAATAFADMAQKSIMLDAPFIRRDVIDLARTVLGRCLNFLVIRALENRENRAEVKKIQALYLDTLEQMRRLLSTTADFSVFATLRAVQSTAPTNPRFETALKRNIHNSYCSQPAYELIEGVFVAEGVYAFDALAEGEENAGYGKKLAELEKHFIETPLEALRPQAAFPLEKTLAAIAQLLPTVAAALEKAGEFDR